MIIDVSSKPLCGSPGLAPLGGTYLLNTESGQVSTNDLFVGLIQFAHDVVRFQDRDRWPPEALTICPASAGFRILRHFNGRKMDMSQKLRARVEKAVSVYLRDTYAVTGNASTVVKGVNWTIAIGDGEQTIAFVRLYRTSGRSQADAASELAVLRAVQDTPVLDVSRPFEDRWGRTLSEVELPDGTQRLVAVFAPALGRELTATAADYWRAGAALSDLHRQSELTRLAPQRELLSEFEDKQTLAMIANRSRSVADGITEALDALKNLGANKLIGPVGFCHGDVRPANMRIERERVTIFDFDDCGRGPQWLDVAAMALWLEVLPCDHPAALWRAFLDGYGLPESEALSLFVRWLVAKHQLRITRFLFDYCELDAALWDQALNQARSVVCTAAHGDLRAFALP